MRDVSATCSTVPTFPIAHAKPHLMSNTPRYSGKAHTHVRCTRLVKVLCNDDTCLVLHTATVG
jgi:hypothetical protein